MRRCLILAAIASLMLTGCYATRIVTVSPDSRYVGSYSTTVTVPRTPATTTTTHVTAVSEDISLCLDLQAVGAAFAQSATVEEFENLLNNSSYMLSNLDLNRDGYVDYLRVMETVQGNAHVFVIQAVLADNVYQDVATLVAEVSAVYTNACVQIIGAPYVYGPKYIIQPVYVAVPAIYPYLVRPRYVPWHSPWHWGYFPPHYRCPAPVYVSHYHAYVNTYMRNHRYCHEFRYAPTCHYPDFERVCQPVCRNDYGARYPERSFIERNANTPARSVSGQNPRTVTNARDLREAVDAESVTRTATSSSTTGGGSRGASAGTSRSATGTTSTSGSRGTGTATTSGGSRSSAGSSVSRSSKSVSSTDTGQTTVRSNVNSSGTARTRINTTTPSGTSSSVNRSSSSASRSSSSVRSSSGSVSRSSGSSSSSGSGSRSSAGSGNSSSGSRSTGSSSSRTGSRR